MAQRALATAFVNIVPGTKEFEAKLKSQLNGELDKIGQEAGKRLGDGLATSLKSAGQRMTSVGKSLTLGVTAPLAAIGIASAKTAADFGVAMASLEVNAQASGKQMESLRALAIKMGQDTVFSAGDAANAMLELSKGGLTPAEIEAGALASSMNLAATEGIALAEASTIVINAMNTFGLSAKDSGQAVDILAAGAVASTAGVQELASGLKFVGSTAATLKVPLGDTVTALAALNNAGIDSSTAGTSLNQFLLRLIPNTRKAAEEAKKLGINFVDQEGQLKPMTDVIDELSKTYSGMGDAARIASLKTIFGVEGMRAANILINEGAEGYDKLSKAVNEQGVAADLANARMGGLAGVIEQLKGSVDTALLAIGDRLSPALTTIGTILTTVINAFASLDPGVQSFIVTLGVVAAALGPVLIFLGNLTTAIGTLIPVVKALFAALGANPFGLVVIAIAAVVAGIIYLATKTTFFQDAWKSLTEFMSKTVGPVIGDVVNLVKDGFQRLVQAIRPLIEAILPVLANYFKAVFTVAQFLAKVVITVLVVAIKVLVEVLKFIMPIVIGIIGVFANMAAAVINTGSKIFGFFGNLGKTIIGAVKGAGTWLFDIGKNIIQGLINGAGSLLRNLGQFFLDLVPDWIEGPFKKALGIASPSKVFAGFGKNIIQGLQKGLLGGESEIRSTMKKVSSWVRDAVKSGDLPKAVGKAAQALVKTYRAELLQLTNEHDQVVKRLEKAQEKLAERLDQKLQFVQDISAKYGAGYELNEETTAAVAIQGLKDRIAKARELGKVTDQLVEMGLNEDLYKQIVEAGAVDFARSIIEGGSAAVDELNILSKEANKQAIALAERVGSVLYDEGIAFAQSVVNGLESEEERLSNLMERVAQRFANQLNGLVASALGQESSGSGSNKNFKGTRPGPDVDGKKKGQIFEGPNNTWRWNGSSWKKIPALAKGGFVNRPTTALIGEAGPEVVTPLKDFERMTGLDKVGSGKTINYYAAPNQSIDSERALFTAMKRAEVIAGW